VPRHFPYLSSHDFIRMTKERSSLENFPFSHSLPFTRDPNKRLLEGSDHSCHMLQCQAVTFAASSVQTINCCMYGNDFQRWLKLLLCVLSLSALPLLGLALSVLLKYTWIYESLQARNKSGLAVTESNFSAETSMAASAGTGRQNY